MEYAITILGHSGAIRLSYDQRGLLCCLDIRMFMGMEPYNWFLTNMPIQEQGISGFVAKSSKFKLWTESSPPLFDDFYNAYGLKEKRAKAAVQWDALETLWDKVLAVVMIQEYDRKRGGVAKVFPERYLSERRFDFQIDHFVKKPNTPLR
jgi:hypothetical protein